MTWTMQDKLAAIERELSYRRKVFARRVQNGSMTRELADRQIAIFEARWRGCAYSMMRRF